MKLKLISSILFAVGTIALFGAAVNQSGTSFSFRGLESTNAVEFTSISQADAKADPQLMAAFEWAAQSIILRGYQQNKIPVSQYNVTEWNVAGIKKQKSGIKYRFEVELLGANNVDVEANMTVFYRHSNKSYNFNGYSYKASNIADGALNNTKPIKPTNPTKPTKPTKPGKPTTTSPVVPPTSNTTSDQYLPLDKKKILGNKKVMGAVKYGAQEVAQRLIDQGKIPSAFDRYLIKNIVKAEYLNKNGKALYQLEVKMINAANVHLDLTYIVSFNGGYKLKYFKYKAYNYTWNNGKPVENTPAPVASDNTDVQEDPKPVVVDVTDNSEAVIASDDNDSDVVVSDSVPVAAGESEVEVSENASEVVVSDVAPVETNPSEAVVSDVPVSENASEVVVSDVAPVETNPSEAVVSDVPVSENTSEVVVSDAAPVETNPSEAVVSDVAVSENDDDSEEDDQN